MTKQGSMHGNGKGGKMLVDKIKIDPNFIIMQAGGNVSETVYGIDRS